MEVSETDNLDYEELKELFSFFDRDGEGKITVAELQVLLMLMGQYPSTKEFEELLSDCDTSRDGEITYEKYEMVVQKRMNFCNPEEELKEAISFFTKDGILKLDEMLYAITNSGDNRLTQEEVFELDREISLTQGHVTSEEFLKVLSISQ